MDRNRFSLNGNELKASYARKAAKWQDMFTNRFEYDPDEHYNLSLKRATDCRLEQCGHDS